MDISQNYVLQKDLSGTLILDPNLGSPLTITFPVTTTPQQVAAFTTVNNLPSTTILNGLWDLNIYASASSAANRTRIWMKIGFIDNSGNFSIISDGTTDKTVIDNNTVTPVLYENTLFVPTTVVPSITTKIQVQIWCDNMTSNNTLTLSFRNGTLSHIHTTLLSSVAGYTGATGPTGPTLPIQGQNSGYVVVTNPLNTRQVYYNDGLYITESPHTVNVNGTININTYTGPSAPNGINLSGTGSTGPTGGVNLFTNSSIVPNINNTFSLGYSGTDASGNNLLWSNVYANNVYAKTAMFAPVFRQTSDYRIKDNVKQLDDTFTVRYLNPVSYINSQTNKQDIGLLAHELQEQFPELVTGEKDGPEIQTVNYVGLIGVLIKEIQKLQKINTTYEKKINDLQNSINNHEIRIRKLEN